MGFRFPFTQMSELNLDWVLSKVKEITDKVNSQLHDLTELEEKVDSAVYSVDNMTVEATTLQPEDDATATKSIINGHINIDFGIPKGDKGDPGEDGQDGAPGTPATDAQVQTAVNAWLSDNVDPDSGYVLDRTLTQNNAAAPADLVGTFRDTVAPKFTASANYKKGYFVYYNDILYEFTQDHPAGAWTGTDVAINTVTNNVRKNEDDISDLKSAMNKPTLKWTIGININGSGVIGTNVYTALTDIFPVKPGDIIVRQSDVKDANNKDLIFYVASYSTTTNNNDTFIERVALYKGEGYTAPANCTGCRILFGRAGASGTTFVESDITNYFKADYYLKPTSNADFLEYKATTENNKVHTGSEGAMLEVAESWFNAAYDPNNQLIYLALHGPYTTPYDDNDKKCTVCSQFVKSVITGTTYKDSIFEQSANLPAWWGYEYDGSSDATYLPNNYLVAADIAKYCAAKGWLVEYVSDHRNVKPGDLLFFESDGDITHVAICIQPTISGYRIIEANLNYTRYVDGAAVALKTRDIQYSGSSAPTSYAHLPICPSEYKTELMLLDKKSYSGTYSSSSSSMKNYEFANSLQKGFYTLALDVGGNSQSLYIKLNSSKNNENFEMFKQGSTAYCVFYAQIPIEQIDVRCSTGTSYEASNIRLYKGYMPYDGRVS